LRQLENSDFGIFVFSPDDEVTLRGQKTPVVRDNVLFELGMFIGKLGYGRSFIVKPRDKELRIPSDILGMTLGEYETGREDKSWNAATGPVCNRIRERIRTLGRIREIEENTETISEVTEVDEKTGEEKWSEMYRKNEYEEDLKEYDKYTESKLNMTEEEIQKNYYVRLHIEYMIDPKNSVEDYLKLIKNGDSIALDWLVFNYMNDGVYSIALKICKENIELLYTKHECVIRYYDCLNYCNKEEDAKLVLKDLETKFGNEVPVLLKLHKEYSKDSRMDIAHEFLHKSYLLDPKNEGILYTYANHMYENSNNDVALYLFDRCLEMNNENSDYHGKLGNVLYNHELYDQAIAEYHKAIELDKENAGWLYANIGNIYNNLGLIYLGEKYFNKSNDIRPNSEYTYKRMSEVQSKKESNKSKRSEIKSNGIKILNSYFTD
jgi:tetratricopeptide (TPR) repeat protein